MSTAITSKQLRDDLCGPCGLSAGDTVIVHASARAVGSVEGGAAQIAQALQDVVTPDGTVLVPTFSPPKPDGIFNRQTTPSATGFVTECFRLDPQAVRSLHPTHSVVGWGRQARELTTGHEHTAALGPDSPFHKAAAAGAAILMIGCDLTKCSLIHVAEALVRVPYLGKALYPGYDRPLTIHDGDAPPRSYRPVDVPGDSNGFGPVQDTLEQRGQLTRGKLGQAAVVRVDAMTCLNTAVELLRADPAALLCDQPKCLVCPPSRKIVAQAITSGRSPASVGITR